MTLTTRAGKRFETSPIVTAIGRLMRADEAGTEHKTTVVDTSLVRPVTDSERKTAEPTEGTVTIVERAAMLTARTPNFTSAKFASPYSLYP
jgi:hypothetical protein